MNNSKLGTLKSFIVTVFIDKYKSLKFEFITPTLSPHLRNLRFPPALSFLEYSPRSTSCLFTKSTFIRQIISKPS